MDAVVGSSQALRWSASAAAPASGGEQRRPRSTSDSAAAGLATAPARLVAQLITAVQQETEAVSFRTERPRSGPGAAPSAAARRRLPQLAFKEAVETSGTAMGAKRFTAYTIEVSLLGHSWEVSKRYSEFDDLRAALEKAYVPHIIPRGSWPAFPGKHILGNFSANVVATRSSGLQAFMGQMLLISPVCDDRILLDFLQAPAAKLTSGAIDAGQRRFYKRVSTWRATPEAADACVGGTAVSPHDLAEWAWERGLENHDLTEVWGRFADASVRLDPRALRAALVAQASVRGRSVRRQLQRSHACATLVQQFVRQRWLASFAMLTWRRPGRLEEEDGAVSWQLRGIAAISPSRAADAPMFRCTSAPFPRLNRRWNLIAQIDRSADAVGLFLRETSADPQQQLQPQPQQTERSTVSFLLELVAKGPGGEIVLAQHRSDSCQFTTAPPDASPVAAAAAAWGNLRMATLQQVRSTALWCTVFARVVIANDPAGLNEALQTEESAGLATPTRAAASPFSTPPASVHPMLLDGSTPGSGASAEGSPAQVDAASAPRRLDLSPDIAPTATAGASLDPEFPALSTTPAAHHAAVQWAPPASAESSLQAPPQLEVGQPQVFGGSESAAAADEDSEAVAAIEAAAAMRARLAAMIGDMDE